MPDSRTLKDCQIPVFKSHPTPINVSLKPDSSSDDDLKKKHHDAVGSSAGGRAAASAVDYSQSSQGCSCTIL